ncbi:ParA family protein [Methylovorus glucosotrophus]|uniref:Cobyrinic acid ac-diamide synthase n=1 Tax=Methylovorus glucosotrophus (strain SIP3-4) TaxID=582744 RepID=C6XER4_METGS|nr:ParA family protein [Methylovorus glucosotrophus]ACT52121.1 Cobyrinic acid ac-diamide synthase [Methylovorus glucosotrophus SIP3-4]
MAKVIAVSIQKGGDGKTTFACNLAMAAVKAGYRTALIDLDSQGNAGVTLSGNGGMHRIKEGGAQQIYEEDVPKFTETESGVFILHGHSWLEEIDYRENVDVETLALREKVRTLPFDYVIIDTPPSSGPRQMAALLWSDLVIVPVKAQKFSMIGLSKVLEQIKLAKRRNHGLAYRVVINQFVTSSSEQNQISEELREQLPGVVMKVFKSRVPVSDMLARGLPVWEYKKDKALAQEWYGFCTEVLHLI